MQDTNKAGPGVYEIRLKGHLDERWASWFGGMTVIRDDNGDTLLTGPVIDQAALHGLLRKVRDLGITLRSVNCIEQHLPGVPQLPGEAQPNPDDSIQSKP
jgi:hypothetical protein